MLVMKKESAEKTFTKIEQMRYNEANELVERQLEAESYLPTNDVAFKKMLASPENIHMSEGLLRDLALYDPLGALEIGGLEIETPYNFKDANQLKEQKEKYKHGVLYTEVDFACRTPEGGLYLIEMQMRGESHLEKRIAYNVSEKYTSLYAGVEKGLIKYGSLKPVISIVILKESYFKDDPVPVRYLRPHDARHDLYKKDLNLGLEIYLELDKDASGLPKNLQHIFEFFRTGKVSADAKGYLKEAADGMKKTNFTPEERKLADFYIRAQLKRESEDAYVLEQGRLEEREKAEVEKAKILKKEEEKRLNAACKLLSKGIQVEDVAEALDLDIEIVSNLKQGNC